MLAVLLQDENMTTGSLLLLLLGGLEGGNGPQHIVCFLVLDEEDLMVNADSLRSKPVAFIVGYIHKKKLSLYLHKFQQSGMRRKSRPVL